MKGIYYSFMRVFELMPGHGNRIFYIPGSKYWVYINNSVMISDRSRIQLWDAVEKDKDFVEVFESEILYICEWVKRIYDESI